VSQLGKIKSPHSRIAMSLPASLERRCFTTGFKGTTIHLPAEKLLIPQVSQLETKLNIMGDRDPKSNQKKSTQKQSKASTADQQKKQAVFAKQAANKKK